MASAPDHGRNEATTTEREPRRADGEPKRPSQWNVVLLNDEEHTYEYVIRMLQELFRHTPEQAVKTAQTVDREGRAICLTTHREHAELKREQIHSFGRDPAMATCQGAMSSVIEPAP